MHTFKFYARLLAALLCLALTGCNLPSALAPTPTVSPTVTVTAIPGATATSLGITPTQTEITEATAAPTITVFSLPPTPGQTATQPYATIPPHITNTPGGETSTPTVQAPVQCLDNWFFANPPPVCPAGSAALTGGASEHFEHGWMLWVGATGTIYVLYDGDQSPRWSAHSNQWSAGLPESDPAIVPPAGFYQPIRGFGWLWRTEAGGGPGSPRARLGWAVETEVSFTTAFQCDSAANCYIKGPIGETVWLKPNGSGWQIGP